MFVVAGLGNPGKEYDDTRHNIGYRVVDQLAAMYRTKIRTMQCQALTANIDRLGADSFLIAKPITFMNLSGVSIAPLMNKYHLAPDKLIVVHDDLDLDCGAVQIKFDGSTAGHRGLRSIADRLGTLQFLRVRLGIGRPYDKDEVVDYVLSRFRTSEKGLMGDAVILACQMILDCMDYGFSYTANKYPRSKNNTQ